MVSFCYYDNSAVIVTLIITNVHLSLKYSYGENFSKSSLMATYFMLKLGRY